MSIYKGSQKIKEVYYKDKKIAAVFKGSQRVYGKSTENLTRPPNLSASAPLSTTQNTASKDMWVFTHRTSNDDHKYLYTSKSDGSNQVTLTSHQRYAGYSWPKGSGWAIVTKGWKYWINSAMTDQGAYYMLDADTAYLSNTSYDKYAPLPDYTRGVSQSADTVYQATQNVWVSIPPANKKRYVYVGKTSGAVTTEIAYNNYAGYTNNVTTTVFIPKGWYYKTVGVGHTRWLCKGE